MNNIDLKILERVHAGPGYTPGGLEDSIGRGPRTKRAIDRLVADGYLVVERGLRLSDKGFGRIDSSSPANRLRRLGATVAIPLAIVVAGSAIWHLIVRSFT